MRETIKICAVILILFTIKIASNHHPHQAETKQISCQQKDYPVYPATLDTVPDIPSPYTTAEGTEVILAALENNQFAVVPVTVENGSPLVYSYRIKNMLGKDYQLSVDKGDFPTLAQTGQHSEQELDQKDRITGFPVDMITYIGRPDRFSYAGFMAEDEDIISVLTGDNRMVKNLALTHPQTAKPLFHVWNLILEEMERGKWGRFWTHVPYFFYNGHKVYIKAEGTKGWQLSIFQDEIKGNIDIEVRRELEPEEKDYLAARYAHLTPEQMTTLTEKLSKINFSEMAPYYIMRYGFYEGHTSYRTDPIAISFVFGLKSLEEIDKAFQGRLYQTLLKHFTKEH
ncbi:hypothetical protein JW935_15240 [candidate division KSB1 bacterium]|nr:hypothetical protein [candidate division KSB1 bacterium]